MGLLNWLRNRRETTLRGRTAIVEFDGLSIICRRPSGLVEAVQWSDSQAVIIQTTDQGPLLDDVFWVLIGKNSGCVVPSESIGTDKLLERLQRLPGFDNQKVIEAMKCTDNGKFLCWKQEDSADRL